MSILKSDKISREIAFAQVQDKNPKATREQFEAALKALDIDDETINPSNLNMINEEIARNNSALTKTSKTSVTTAEPEQLKTTKRRAKQVKQDVLALDVAEASWQQVKPQVDEAYELLKAETSQKIFRGTLTALIAEAVEMVDATEQLLLESSHGKQTELLPGAAAFQAEMLAKYSLN